MKSMYSKMRWLFLLIAITSCQNSTEPDTNTRASQEIILETISAQEAKTLIDENVNNTDFMIIDVRTPGEYATDHIPTAINIDFRDDEFENQINQLNKWKTYLIYCASGNRSGEVLLVMKNLGFRSVYNLNGGIAAWKTGGFPVTS